MTKLAAFLLINCAIFNNFCYSVESDKKEQAKEEQKRTKEVAIEKTLKEKQREKLFSVLKDSNFLIDCQDVFEKPYAFWFEGKYCYFLSKKQEDHDNLDRILGSDELKSILDATHVSENYMNNSGKVISGYNDLDGKEDLNVWKKIPQNYQNFLFSIKITPEVQEIFNFSGGDFIRWENRFAQKHKQSEISTKLRVILDSIKKHKFIAIPTEVTNLLQSVDIKKITDDVLEQYTDKIEKAVKSGASIKDLIESIYSDLSTIILKQLFSPSNPIKVSKDLLIGGEDLESIFKGNLFVPSDNNHEAFKGKIADILNTNTELKNSWENIIVRINEIRSNAKKAYKENLYKQYPKESNVVFVDMLKKEDNAWFAFHRWQCQIAHIASSSFDILRPKINAKLSEILNNPDSEYKQDFFSVFKIGGNYFRDESGIPFLGYEIYEPYLKVLSDNIDYKGSKELVDLFFEVGEKASATENGYFNFMAISLDLACVLSIINVCSNISGYITDGNKEELKNKIWSETKKWIIDKRMALPLYVPHCYEFLTKNCTKEELDQILKNYKEKMRALVAVEQKKLCSSVDKEFVEKVLPAILENSIATIKQHKAMFLKGEPSYCELIEKKLLHIKNLLWIRSGELDFYVFSENFEKEMSN